MKFRSKNRPKFLQDEKYSHSLDVVPKLEDQEDDSALKLLLYNRSQEARFSSNLIFSKLAEANKRRVLTLCGKLGREISLNAQKQQTIAVSGDNISKIKDAKFAIDLAKPLLRHEHTYIG